MNAKVAYQVPVDVLELYHQNISDYIEINYFGQDQGIVPIYNIDNPNENRTVMTDIITVLIMLIAIMATAKMEYFVFLHQNI